MKETCRWRFHKWGKWRVEHAPGYDSRWGKEYELLVQVRHCPRCGKRKQRSLRP